MEYWYLEHMTRQEAEVAVADNLSCQWKLSDPEVGARNVDLGNLDKTAQEVPEVLEVREDPVNPVVLQLLSLEDREVLLNLADLEISVDLVDQGVYHCLVAPDIM